MTTANLQPLTFSSPPEQLRASFLKISHTNIPDPLWHFDIALPKTARIAPSSNAIPQPGGPLISLALFNSPHPSCDIEILGQHLPHELDPADYLDLWTQQNNFQVLSRVHIPTLGGAVGDLIIRWQANNSPFLGRIFATKAGPRLIILWFRTAEPDYPQLAESMFLSLTTFRMHDDSPGPLAEQIRWVGSTLPLQWRTAIPTIWQIKEEPATPQAASFEATLLDAATSTILGKLSFAVIAPDQANNPNVLFDKLFAAVRAANVQFKTPFPATEPTPSPFLGSWHSQTPATANNQPAEIHARVLRHPHAWIAALIITPPRTASPELWMHNKRLLDISTATLEISSPTP